MLCLAFFPFVVFLCHVFAISISQNDLRKFGATDGFSFLAHNHLLFRRLANEMTHLVGMVIIPKHILRRIYLVFPLQLYVYRILLESGKDTSNTDHGAFDAATTFLCKKCLIIFIDLGHSWMRFEDTFVLFKSSVGQSHDGTWRYDLY